MEVERDGQALAKQGLGVLGRNLLVELFDLLEFLVVWIVFVEFLY
jgi:hypothetical protein